MMFQSKSCFVAVNVLYRYCVQKVLSEISHKLDLFSVRKLLIIRIFPSEFFFLQLSTCICSVTNICEIVVAATSDVKETKESEKKADPLKEPPLESDALVKVTVR